MTRIPLRPLARVLDARQKGENPDVIERENRRRRHEEMRDRSRRQAEGRLVLMAGCFLIAFGAIGVKMGVMAVAEPVEPTGHVAGNAMMPQRADIVDRQGRILATNLSTNSLYAQPPHMIDKARAARELAAIFPDLDEDRLLKDFTGKRKFLWIKQRISPEQQQLVHDIGDPGLLFGPREMRLYPNGRLAAHILGGVRFDKEDVRSAELLGVAGIERALDAELRDPAREGAPVKLSIDMAVQSALREVLDGSMKLMNAKGAAGILMDVHSGEIVAMASLPDFDPNDRPRPLTSGDAADSPLFNRAVQGVYELGSTFKIFAAAQALELGQVTPETIIDTSGPMRSGGFTIREYDNKNYGKISVAEIIEKSSNRGTGRLALEIGAERQQAFLRSFGVFDPSPVELIEAPGTKPMLPPRWSQTVTITASYGHGFSSSPLNLATAYASLLNGGTKVTPTLLKRERIETGERLVKEQVSRQAAEMLRRVVTDGTASMGEVPGYEVGGKTGTANKVKPTGGYYEDRNINTFAGVFPVSDPQYVVVVSLDEANDTSGSEPRRTAGWTAVPVTRAIVERAAPLLGVRPVIEPRQTSELIPVSD